MTAMHLDKVDRVVARLDADPSRVDLEAGDQAPLQVAACKGDPALVGVLLDHGADVGVDVGWKEWTPLHWAAQSGSVEVVRLLLAHGAAREARDQDDSSPLALAAERGYGEVVALLESEDVSA